MGCAQSRIDNEESVARCKDRRNLMKDAVTARNAFAAGQSGYAVALKNTGAALSDYGHGEVLTESHDQDHHQSSTDSTSQTLQPPPPPPLDMDQLPPSPPPLPNFSPSPIKRANSMPAISLDRKPGHRLRRRQIGSGTIAEEGEEEGEGEGEEEEQHDVNVGNRNEKNLDTKVGPQITPDNNNNNNNNNNDDDNVRPPPLPPMMDSKNLGAWDYFFFEGNISSSGFDAENENRNANNVEFSEIRNNNNININNNNNNVDDDVEPKTPEKAEKKVEVEVEVEVEKGKQIEHFNTAPAELMRVAKTVVSSVNLMQVLNVIDDHFLKASETAQEVSKMLEATKLHYHSNFADNRGHIDHSARVMRVITWNRSFKGVPNGEGAKDEFDSEEYETHATVLDKLLAWEKKLYDEVKQGELMKLEYKRKVALLSKQKKRNASAESLEKTKAAVSHLHTRYIVDMQSMDSTVSEVNRLRDEQLYPKLVALVDGMARMWDSMSIHHDNQLKIVTDLKSLDITQASKETTKHHYERTTQLWHAVQDWHSQFEKLVTHQKQYIQYLNSWLKLNLIPIESSLKEKISSPPRVQKPPIQALLLSWHDYLESLPHEVAKSAISSFAAVIKTILLQQEEEMKLKEKCEETRKEFLRKNQAFEEWYQKYMQRRTPPDEMDGERGEDANPKDPVSERQFVVESLKKRLEEEVEAHQRICLQVREKSLGTLKLRLPELFRAMSEYVHTCSDAYGKLRSITQSQKSNGGPP